MLRNNWLARRCVFLCVAHRLLQDPVGFSRDSKWCWQWYCWRWHFSYCRCSSDAKTAVKISTATGLTTRTDSEVSTENSGSVSHKHDIYNGLACALPSGCFTWIYVGKQLGFHSVRELTHVIIIWDNGILQARVEVKRPTKWLYLLKHFPDSISTPVIRRQNWRLTCCHRRLYCTDLYASAGRMWTASVLTSNKQCYIR